jgi:hypothetical protein
MGAQKIRMKERDRDVLEREKGTVESENDKYFEKTWDG